MNVFHKTLTVGFLAAVSFAPAAHAEKFFGGSSISILHSDEYQGFGRQDIERTVFTFENVTVHNWGGTFFFIDRDQNQGSNEGVSPFGENTGDDVYGEFSPTLSGSWLTGQDLSFGPVKDVFLAGTYEFGGGLEANNYLTGFGLAWDVPGFQYFNTAFYYVTNDTASDDQQVTVTWAYPFSVGPALFLIDGYIDWSSASSTNQSELQIVPQVKLDVSNFWGEPGVLYAGIEYQHWNNKFGAADEDIATQDSISALVKFHF